MSGSWYKNSMPKIKDVIKHLNVICNDISNITHVKKAYVWGSFLDNYNNKNFPLRDLDIIVKTNIISDDLLSVDKGSFSLKKEAAIDLGFDPDSISFTKQYTNISNFNIDHWAISKDNKLLHWGPFIESKHEWDELKKEAEHYAEEVLGEKRQNIKSANKLNKWMSEHDFHISLYLKEMPQGWYESEQNFNDIKDLIKEIL